MIKSGQRIALPTLQAMADAANASGLAGGPYRFFGGSIHVFADDGRGLTAPSILVKLADVQIGDLAVALFPPLGVTCWQLANDPATDLANWRAIDDSEIAFAGNLNNMLALDPKPPYCVVLTELLAFAPDQNIPIGIHLTSVEGSLSAFRAHGLYAYRAELVGVDENHGGSRSSSGWAPVGSWADELNRMRHYTLKRLSVVVCNGYAFNPATNAFDILTPIYATRKTARVSGPWPLVMRGDPIGQTILPPVDLYYQSSGTVKGRLAVYPTIMQTAKSGGNNQGWIKIQSSVPGKIKGCVWSTGSGITTIGIATVSSRAFTTVAYANFDTPFAGGEFGFISVASVCRSGPFFSTINIDDPLLERQPVYPGSGRPDTYYGSSIRFEIEVDSEFVKGICAKKLQRIRFPAEALSLPVPRFAYQVFPGDESTLAASPVYVPTNPGAVTDENIGEIVYGFKDDPAVVIDGAMMIAKSVPLGATTRLADYNQIFAPNRKSGRPAISDLEGKYFTWLENVGGFPIVHTLDWVTLPLYPYPCYIDAQPNFHLPDRFMGGLGGDGRLFRGVIAQVTVSRLPNADGKFDAMSPALNFQLGAFNILGVSEFTSLFDGTLAANQHSRTWRSSEPSDNFPFIPVLSPIPMAYKCGGQTLLVQPMFLPEQDLPVNALPPAPHFSFYSGRPYIAAPILANAQQDTEALNAL